MAKPSCWLAQFSDVPCDGRLVKCHLIPKQVIKREVDLRTGRLSRRKYDERVRAVLWDPGCWAWGCGGAMGLSGHHGAFDGCQIRVPRASLPPELERFAVQYGLGWFLDRTYGLLAEEATR